MIQVIARVAPVEAFRLGHDEQPEWFTSLIEQDMCDPDDGYYMLNLGWCIHGARDGDWIVYAPTDPAGTAAVWGDEAFQAEYRPATAFDFEVSPPGPVPEPPKPKREPVKRKPSVWSRMFG